MKIFISGLIILLFLFCLPLTKSVFAVSVGITNFPSSISSDSFTVNVSVLGASSGTNYIRVDLYKDGTSNYFGETYNGSDWYSGSEGKQYFPITIINSKSTASASLQSRLGAPNSSDYDGQGSYKMRIRRYTSSGGQGSEDPNNSAVSIVINMPTSTPVPTSVPTPAPVSNSPTPISYKTPTPTRTQILTKKLIGSISPLTSKTGNILGESTASISAGLTKEPQKTTKVLAASENRISQVLIGIGFAFLIACGIVAGVQKIRKDRLINE